MGASAQGEQYRMGPKRIKQDGVGREAGGMFPQAVSARLDGRCHNIRDGAHHGLRKALMIQAKHSVGFLMSATCRESRIGAEARARFRQ